MNTTNCITGLNTDITVYIIKYHYHTPSHFKVYTYMCALKSINLFKLWVLYVVCCKAEKKNVCFLLPLLLQFSGLTLNLRYYTFLKITVKVWNVCYKEQIEKKGGGNNAKIKWSTCIFHHTIFFPQGNRKYT